MMRGDAVEARDVEIRGARGAVLLNVPSFTLPPGEACGVYGPSSQGDTLFLSCVSGARVPQRGTVLIHGVPLGIRNADQLSLGVLPKEGGLFPDFTVIANLNLALRYSTRTGTPRSTRRHRIEEMVERFQLDPWVHVQARHVPVGVRRRVDLACALIHHPALLVADDPWGRADIESHDLIDQALQDHCRRGNTLLFSSPREAEISRIATEICLFKSSSIVARGTLEDLRQSLAHSETIRVRVQDHGARLHRIAEALPGTPSHQVKSNTLTLRVPPGSLRLNRLAEHLQSAGLEILEMRIQKPGLAEVYDALVGPQGDRNE